MSPAVDGSAHGIDAADAVLAELRRTIEARRKGYPDMITKGRMRQAEADHKLALLTEIAAEVAIAFGPPPWRPRGAFSWVQKVAELQAELATRERFYPDRISKGRLTEAEAAAQIAAIAVVLDLYKRQLFTWTPPADIPARWSDPRYRQAVRDQIAEAEQKEEEPCLI